MSAAVYAVNQVTSIPLTDMDMNVKTSPEPLAFMQRKAECFIKRNKTNKQKHKTKNKPPKKSYMSSFSFRIYGV